jgi:hypothetical protein
MYTLTSPTHFLRGFYSPRAQKNKQKKPPKKQQQKNKHKKNHYNDNKNSTDLIMCLQRKKSYRNYLDISIEKQILA